MAAGRHKHLRPGPRWGLAPVVAVVTALCLSVASVAAVVASPPSDTTASTTATTVDAAASMPLIVRSPAVSRADERVALTSRVAQVERAERQAARQRAAARAERQADRRKARLQSNRQDRRKAQRRAERTAERQAERKPPPPPIVEAEVTDHEFLTAPLNVWSGPGERYTRVTVLAEGTKVAVTGGLDGGRWAQVVHQGRVRWVNAAYLADAKPRPEPTPRRRSTSGGSSSQASTAGGLSTAPCRSGSSVESGLHANAVAVHRAVCASFPGVTSYGGLRADGMHGMGLALDIMVSSSTGNAVAEYVRANAGALGVSEVIWAQRIWTVQRSSEGWRAMEDRGSATANHYDHVHVTTY